METLSLEVTRVRWRAPDGAFAVLDALTDAGEEICVTGALAHVHEGESIDVRGGWREHDRFGTQFRAEEVRVQEPVSEVALLGLLSAVRHVGVRGAAFLLDRHGAAVLDAIDADPGARLREVPGIGSSRIAAAVRSWQELRAGRALRLFLDAHGVPPSVAGRAAATLGPAAVEVLTEDPYRLCDLDGVGFATADALARGLGLEADAPARLRAGVVHALRDAERDGHCHLPRGVLAERARRLLGADADDAIDELAASGAVVLVSGEGPAARDDDGEGWIAVGGPAGGDLVARPALHAAEERLGAHVRELTGGEPAFALEDVERPREGAFVATDDQWAGVTNALGHRLSILTGGPGVGKTACLRTLVDVLGAHGRRVRLCAPTGKAARRLTESTGAHATTIHRLLEWMPGEGPVKGPGDPISGADVLVVDEASMLDVRLAEALLAAVGPATHVVLVGDPDQLAPVGPGRVLDDLLASGAIPVTRLTEVFRQAARSLIVRAAHAINRGEHPPLVPPPDVERDVFLVARHDPAAIVEEIVSLATRRLPSHYGLDARADVQVLAPMHRGPVGIETLNAELRAVLNPDGPAVPGTALRVGDRVVQTVNDHERELMNGEVGVLVDHDAERDRAMLATDDGRMLAIPTGALGTLRLAHAMSVHKAQGSSAKAVVIPLFRGHAHMLTRNLVYTALTRAERLAVFVGQPEALGLALGRVDARRRHTRLAGLVALEARAVA